MMHGRMAAPKQVCRKRIAAVLAVLLLALQLAGCSATELENRCFPMLAVADYRVGLVEFCFGFPVLSQKSETDVEESKVQAAMAQGGDFASAVSNYDKQLDKKADCNHLKVLLIGQEMMEEGEACADMFRALRESEQFPRNIYVCVTRDVAELLETEGTLPTDMGSYLQTYLQNHEKEHGGKLVTLGSILDERENHSKVLHLPYLTVEDGSILWDAEWDLDMRQQFFE